MCHHGATGRTGSPLMIPADHRANRSARRTPSCARRGIATYWIIGLVPAALALTVLLTDYGNVWLAREELENAVEAGALAGAKQWGDRSNAGAAGIANRTLAHNAAKTYAEANTILGQTFTVNANNNVAATNNNNVCPGDVLLGRVLLVGAGPFYDFNASVSPGASPAFATRRGCRVSATTTVNSLWVGFGVGPYTIRATAVARYAGGGAAKLISTEGDLSPCL